MDSELWNTYLAAIPMPLILVGEDERILSSNAAAREIFGSLTEGRHYVTVLRQPALLDAVESVRSGGQAARARYLATELSRDTVYNVTAAPVRGGDIHGVLISFENITHVKDAEQMRRDFVANVSHELRTPLTALLGFIETLRGAARDDAEARERFLTIMEREAVRMNRLVHDLLSLSRVESAERVRPTEEVDLAGILSSSVLTLRPQAEAAGVRLQLDGVETPCTIIGDGDQLLQVFNNLIENAIKYGGRDGADVTIRLDRTHQEPGFRPSAVRIDVIDQGEGIDDTHIARLTERFYRIDSHRSRELGGTGLGLAIVKHILNRHRGRLRIHSELGQGSRFSVVLPFS